MADYTSTQSGDWSDTNTWGSSGPPGAGDRAIISAGHTVLIDGNTTVGLNGGTAPSNSKLPSAYDVVVYGTLGWKSPTADWTFDLQGNMLVLSGGTFEIGNSGTPIPSTRIATMTFTGTPARRVMMLTGGTVRLFGAPAYHMASASMQRAQLASAVSLGSGVQIQLDKDVDWEAGDEIWLAVGGDRLAAIMGAGYTTLAAGYGQEKATILTRVNASTYTVNLTYNHTAGDMVVHASRNVVLSGTFDLYAYYESPTWDLNWATLDENGAAYAIRTTVTDVNNGTLVVKNVVVDYDDYPGNTYAVYLTNVKALATDRDIDELHVWRANKAHKSVGTDGKWYLGHITSLATAEYAIDCAEAVDVESLWYTNATAARTATHTPINLVQGYIRSMKCHLANAGFVTSDGVSGASAGTLRLENAEVYHCASGGVQNLARGREVFLRNVAICDCYYEGMNTGGGTAVDTHAENCSFDKCNQANAVNSGAVLLDFISALTTNWGVENRFRDCTFGSVYRNKRLNLFVGSYYPTYENRKVLLENCTFKEPESASSASSEWEAVIPWVFWNSAFNSGGPATRYSFSRGFSIELINPTVLDSSDVDQWPTYYPDTDRVVFGGGGMEMHQEGTTVIDSTFNRRMSPFNVFAPGAGSRNKPLIIPADKFSEVEVQLSLRKNVSVPAGDRPAVHLRGLGIDESVEMGNGIDTWEELVLRGSTRTAGFVRLWAETGKNEYDTTGVILTPEPIDTRIVFADGLSRSKTKLDDDPKDHWWTFASTDYATLAAADADKYNPPGSFTAVVCVKLDASIPNRTMYPLSKYSLGPVAGWGVGIVGPAGDLRASVSADGSAWDSQDVSIPTNDEDGIVLATAYNYKGNGFSTLQAIIGRSGGPSSASKSTALGPVFAGTSELTIGRLNGLSTSAFQGRLYWVAFYPRRVLTTAQVQGLYSGTYHPLDFAPSFFVDFHKAVGGTYGPEVGNYQMTVTGTPVAGAA